MSTLNDEANDLTVKIISSITEGVALRQAHLCIAGCGKDVSKLTPADFKDELSMKEFCISGICQQCQDGFFVEQD